jgi:hypothetical protein
VSNLFQSFSDSFTEARAYPQKSVVFWHEYSKRVCAEKRESLKTEVICDSLDKTELLKLQGLE